ncbi:hypothetical protein NQ317_014220 [Molorchus minor]|uniref:Uncharacterized protein n=1 Tax=Molorchus minor TaxID=1323400 RepID=A0ABQ9JE46_9CUCU|nr:hypothetical protein NQ317_014220 [Molorchus minor]
MFYDVAEMNIKSQFCELRSGNAFVFARKTTGFGSPRTVQSRSFGALDSRPHPNHAKKRFTSGLGTVRFGNVQGEPLHAPLALVYHAYSHTRPTTNNGQKMILDVRLGLKTCCCRCHTLPA